VVSFKNIVVHILQEHGFEVYEKEDILYGERKGELVSVGIFDEASALNMTDYSDKIANVKGTHIVCVPTSVAPEIENMAEARNIVLWKKEDVESEIGRAVISHISDSGQSLLQELMGARPEIKIEGPESLPLVVEKLGTHEHQNVVKLRLSIDDVKEISSKTVQGFKHELELVPHYLFEYLCIYDGKNGEERKSQGIISVNAFTGKYATWDRDPEFTHEIDRTHVQLEPKIDEDRAKDIALKGVVESNTEHDELIIERDHATIIEKTVFSPKEENIVLEKKGLILVPIWCVEGSHGVMILDGTSGKVISEDYYQENRE